MQLGLVPTRYDKPFKLSENVCKRPESGEIDPEGKPTLTLSAFLHLVIPNLRQGQR